MRKRVNRFRDPDNNHTRVIDLPGKTYKASPVGEYIINHLGGGTDMAFIECFEEAVSAPGIAFEIRSVNQTVGIKKEIIVFVQLDGFRLVLGIRQNAEDKAALVQVSNMFIPVQGRRFVAAVAIGDGPFLHVDNAVEQGDKFSRGAFLARHFIEPANSFEQLIESIPNRPAAHRGTSLS